MAAQVVGLIQMEEQEQQEAFKARQRQGIDRAKEQGVQFGRPRRAYPENFARVHNLYRERGLTGEECAKLLQISRSQFMRFVKRFETEETV